ncbi:MAG: glycerophosphodiester phosphodiesterase [Clostridia bacterium]|nr:glycerophosphodiester phosphodiesterase [Clostridia bacterium]
MADFLNKLKDILSSGGNDDYEVPELMYGFTVTHHAGALHQKPNTLESVSYSVFHGAGCIELDVSFRPDGTPVIIHKEEPTSRQGESLEMAFKIIAGSRKCKINLDLKSTKNLPAIDSLVQEYNLKERVYYTGVTEDMINKVKSTSEIPFYLNHDITKEEAEDRDIGKALVEKVKALGAIGVNSKDGFCSEQLCRMMHRRDLYVSIWTVNSIARTKELLSYSVDNITSMKPDILERLIFGVDETANLSVFRDE